MKVFSGDIWGSGEGHSFDDHKSGSTGFMSCYRDHPALKYNKLKLYGGSASMPMVKDADIYISLQSGSTSGYATMPWDEKQVLEIAFPIHDQGVPKSISEFKKMVKWVCNQLQNGKKIHVGCIGGHGRTGMLLSAVIAQLGEKDAIQYVRKHYCPKAVESDKQVNFLVKNFGVSYAEPRHFTEEVIGSRLLSGGRAGRREERGDSDWQRAVYGSGRPARDAAASDSKDIIYGKPEGLVTRRGNNVPTGSIRPVPSHRCIWGRKDEH